ncbi:MAG: gliding motility protein GldL [Cytophagales bacterium]|nr:gliding motility protein GldL [Cytophagales bacterium]MDW8384684.1 gliding motility protein GldL [Flammeovirgaceae bacterium]
MAQIHESGLQKFYRVVVPKVTSLGASLVVVGAMFKIMHWPGAGVMLVIGLSTEAFLFFLGIFQPPAHPEVHYHWENVYPELLDNTKKSGGKKDDPTKSLQTMVGFDKLLAEANLSVDTIKNFGNGIKQLTDSVTKMKDITEASVATSGYTTSLKEATKSISDLNKAYAATVAAMNEMANASKDAKEYHAQIQTITKNLGALNAVYEMELKDANSHLKAMNKFYANLTVAMESMSEASKESALFKEQMSKLTTNLTNLNKVYGNMLAAMKG